MYFYRLISIDFYLQLQTSTNNDNFFNCECILLMITNFAVENFVSYYNKLIETKSGWQQHGVVSVQKNSKINLSLKFLCCKRVA